MNTKPLGGKAYGSIPHFPGSKVGPGDHTCSSGQLRIATQATRDKHDRVIVQEKLDGSNVAVALLDSVLYPITRSGYLANTSPYKQHHLFYRWALENADRFMAVLHNGERLCGEWLIQAHGTRYELIHEPFVAFDLMCKDQRLPFEEFAERIGAGHFIKPCTFCYGRGIAVSISLAMSALGKHGWHGAIDSPEGAVWRVERDNKVDFLAKYVRKEKVNGCYLSKVSGKPDVWNRWPGYEEDYQRWGIKMPQEQI